MNLLIGCRVEISDGILSGTVIAKGTVLGFMPNNRGTYPDVMVLIEGGRVYIYDFYNVKFFTEDLEMLQQIGRTKEERKSFMDDLPNRFRMMDFE